MKKDKNIKKSASLIFAAVMVCFSFLFAFSASAASAKAISSCTVTVAKTVDYTGKTLKPTVTVKSGNTTLKSGTHYTVSYSNNKNFGTAKVVVKAKSGSGYTGSKTVNFSIVPAKAKSFKATSTTSSVTLSWGKVVGATKYIVYSYNASNKKYTKVATVSKNTATIKNLSAGKTYSYAVKAQAVKNKKTYTGAYSDVFSCATAPAKPSSVKLSAIKDTSMTVTWNKVSGASGYKVYSYNSSNKKYTLLATVTSNKATISSLKANTNYKIAVRAYRKVSNTLYYGAYSALASATTQLKVTAKSTTTSVTLSWNKVSGAKNYIVYSYNSSTKKYAKIATVTTNTATIKKLSAGKTYYYLVKAQSVKNKKTYVSNQSPLFSCATAPAKPTSVKLSAIKDTSMTVTWGKVSGASGYKVYSYDSSSKKYTLLKTVTTNTAALSSLKANTSYKIAVRAYRTVSGVSYYSDYSALASAKTLLAKVTGLKATASDYAITLKWTKVSGAAGYNVYSYDTKTKKDIKKVASVSTNKAVIYNLDINKSYSYRVEAYNSSKAAGVKSGVVTAATKRIDYVTKYQNIFKSGTFKINFNMPIEGSADGLDVIYAAKNGALSVSMDMIQMASVDPDLKKQFESLGEDMGSFNISLYRIVSKKKTKSYICIDEMGAYIESSEAEEMLKDFDVPIMNELFAPKAAANAAVTWSTAKIDGKTHSTASYKTAANETCTYYFLNGEPVKIEFKNSKNEKSEVKISSVSSSVEDIALPKEYLPLFVPGL
ncbi:MAG: fibronectin type III domain-containing protein [Ruminococcus sp.]|nr:fibronectin type III domain-containing protein [Ruminococcus sp.]